MPSSMHWRRTPRSTARVRRPAARPACPPAGAPRCPLLRCRPSAAFFTLLGALKPAAHCLLCLLADAAAMEEWARSQTAITPDASGDAGQQALAAVAAATSEVRGPSRGGLAQRGPALSWLHHSGRACNCLAQSAAWFEGAAGARLEHCRGLLTAGGSPAQSLQAGKHACCVTSTELISSPSPPGRPCRASSCTPSSLLWASSGWWS